MQMLSGISRKARIWFLVSFVWLIIQFVLAVSEESDSFREFVSYFFIVGLLPVILGWGLRWILQGKG